LPLLAIGDVHGDFKTETHFGVLRLCPHANYLLVGLIYLVSEDSGKFSGVIAVASPSRNASDEIREHTSPAQVPMAIVVTCVVDHCRKISKLLS
jgi:hypothetical protein